MEDKIFQRGGVLRFVEKENTFQEKAQSIRIVEAVFGFGCSIYSIKGG